MQSARHLVRVHTVAIDDHRRLLLDRDPVTRAWTLPSARLVGAEDPGRVARALVRAAGAVPETPRVASVSSTLEHGEPVLDLTFHCDAKRTWQVAPAASQALWWSLDEITSLDLSAQVRSTLVHVWALLWAEPGALAR